MYPSLTNHVSSGICGEKESEEHKFIIATREATRHVFDVVLLNFYKSLSQTDNKCQGPKLQMVWEIAVL